MPRLLALALLLCPTLALAQTFAPDGQAFVWRSGGHVIRFDGGRWQAGLEGGKQLSFHTFLWHDAWIYETLQGGKVTAPPTLGADGSLTMAGEFSARNDSAPMLYRLQATPGPDGVKVRYEFTKSAPLKLTSGVWLHLMADRTAMTGAERVWADPTGHGTLALPPQGSAERVLFELQDGRSLCLTGPGFREFNSEGSKSSFTTRYNLVPAKFPDAGPAVAEISISFASMPATFPGDINPGREKLALRGAKPNVAAVGRYEKLELAVDLGATYDNPFDPADVALDAVFTSPSGQRRSVPGFFLVPYRREVRDGHEVMIPQAGGGWKVRFAPTELGRYTWSLRLRDRTGEVTGATGSFQCTKSPGKGFIRPSKADPHYLAFDNGAGYFAIGHNLPGYHTSNQLAETAMRKFAAAKENYNRWWLYSYQLGIEWGPKLGWYQQDRAARMDQALDWGQKLGLYYMLCLDTHQDFREGGWERNPYNAKNGGPCANAGEFFTSETARTLYKQRLRYQVARWGYSPSVLCWEFGNEIEGWADSPDTIKLPWTREMSDYLRGLDPFGHPITTSFWSHTGPPKYWQLPNLDIVQTHLYTNDNSNVAEIVRELSLKQHRELAKPHIFGEFGIDSRGGFEQKDPQGWGIHNALWAGLTSFCAGGPMPWWHENYIEPLDLYFHFTALANFTADLPLGKARWEPLAATVEFQDKSRPPDTRDAVITPLQKWGKPEVYEFTLQEDGALTEGRPQALLHGTGHKDIATPVVFTADYPQPGQFVISVTRVSNSGLLRVWVDGQQVKEWDLPCAEGLGKSSVWREQWKLWETVYDQDFTVDIPAGRHQIKVENFGKDWVSVGAYRFTGCQVRRTPNVLAAGLQTADTAVLWLQNRDSDWYNVSQGKVPSVDPTVVTLTGLKDGAWTLETWETWKGTRTRSEKVTVRQGRLVLRLPVLKADVAYKLRRTPAR